MTSQWMLNTTRSSYVVSLLPDGSGLLFNQWGPVTTQPSPAPPLAEQVPYGTPLDVSPLEYATSGTRHIQQVEMVIDHGNSRRGSSWVLEDEPEFTRVDGATRLSAAFLDDNRLVRLILTLETDTAHDIVEKYAHLENLSDETTITLPRAFSGAWPIPVGSSARVDFLAGAWAREFQRDHVELGRGTFSVGSRQGVTGHLFAPCVWLSALTSTTAAAGDTYGVSLAWSGSWRLAVEAPPSGDHVRVSCGIDDEDTVVTLLPGESFTTPSTLGTWSPEGPGGVTRNWHAYQRLQLARSLEPEHHPVVYNSWFATKFDVRLDHQLALADTAAELGVEVFVVDDGWFAGRRSDRVGLGDWTPDAETFPSGLAPLADGVLARGMRFGLWIEPEGVNPDSDLFRTHPDWVYRAGDRPLTTIRHQLVLDLGREDVRNWVERTLRGLLEQYPITYLKWDMNRPISDGGRPGDVHGRQWSVQHAAGYARLMQMLRAEFPHVTVEACAGGGGRIDPAVLGIADVVWPSDETGPRDRLVIQDGFLRAYAPHTMSSWVTDENGQEDRTPTSLEYRFVVAMAGVLGIGADLQRWHETERDIGRRLVDLYRELRPVLHRGEVTLHGEPHHSGYAIEYSDSSRTVLLVYDAQRARRDPVRVYPRALDPDRYYRLRDSDLVLTGASARAAGIEVPWLVAPDADVLVLDPIRTDEAISPEDVRQ